MITEQDEQILEEMRPSCRTCGRKFMGASWSGRCFQCHNDSLVPYESGEDYIGRERV